MGISPSSRMDVSVQSAGYGMRQGCRWTHVPASSPSSSPDEEARLSDIGRADLDRLLEQAYSETIVGVCIERRNGRLWLIAANLPSGRSDFLGRSIANTLVVHGPDTGDVDTAIRGVAARILIDSTELAESLQTAIVEAADENGPGWGVVRDAIDHIIDESAQRAADHRPADPSVRFALRSDASARVLGEELLQAALPRSEGILVAVRPHQSASDLGRLGAWRGLTDEAASTLAIADDRPQIKPWAPDFGKLVRAVGRKNGKSEEPAPQQPPTATDPVAADVPEAENPPQAVERSSAPLVAADERDKAASRRVDALLVGGVVTVFVAMIAAFSRRSGRRWK